jgi:hypothetical protein
MRFTCRTTKATDTQSEYVILLAFARQQWLNERASMLRYSYIACLVCIRFQVSSLYVHKILVAIRDVGWFT